jgi:hypothetical protein
MDDVAEYQWLEQNRRRHLSPEQELLAAVLADAVYLLEREPTSDVGRKEKRDALKWIQSDDRSLFSFLSICEALEIEPESLRQRLHL